MAEAFDDEIMQAARAIMNLPVLSDLAQKQIVLPVTAGGFGLRSMKMITTSSWVASMAQAIQYMSTLVDHKSLSQTLSTEIDGALFTLAQVPGMHALPTDSSEFWQYFTVEPAGAGFQKTLSAAILSEARKSLLTLVEDIQSEKARLIAVAAESAGAWLTMAPTHHLLTMKDEHFNHAARLRLGIRPFDDTRTCQCGGQLALEPCHFMSCASLLKTMTLRHNKILFNIAQVAAMLHVPVKIEPRVDNKDARRADGLFIMQEKTIAIDVSVTHPWAKSYTTMALVPLGAASERIKNAE